MAARGARAATRADAPHWRAHESRRQRSGGAPRAAVRCCARRAACSMMNRAASCRTWGVSPLSSGVAVGAAIDGRGVALGFQQSVYKQQRLPFDLAAVRKYLELRRAGAQTAAPI